MNRFTHRAPLAASCTAALAATLACLGGYGRVEHAQETGLASSMTPARLRLRALEELSFLRKIGTYPVIYQVTATLSSVRKNSHRWLRRPARLLRVATSLEQVRPITGFHWEREGRREGGGWVRISNELG